MQINDPLGLPVREIGQGNIVAHKKREAGVVIFKIEGVSHSLRELIHEAKNTLVGTGAGTVHEIGLKIEPHILPFPLAQPHRPCGSVLRPQGQREPGIIPVEFVVQHIHHTVTIDLQKGLTGVYSGPFRRASRIN